MLYIVELDYHSRAFINIITSFEHIKNISNFYQVELQALNLWLSRSTLNSISNYFIVFRLEFTFCIIL